MYEEEEPGGTRFVPVVMGGLVVCVLAAFGWVFLTQVDWGGGSTRISDDGTRVEVGDEPLTTITSNAQFLSYREASVERGETLLVVFGSTWCGACRQQDPILWRVSSTLPEGTRILYVDTEANREIASRHSIRMLPTHIILRDGREVKRLTGVLDATQIRNALAR